VRIFSHYSQHILKDAIRRVSQPEQIDPEWMNDDVSGLIDNIPEFVQQTMAQGTVLYRGAHIIVIAGWFYAQLALKISVYETNTAEEEGYDATKDLWDAVGFLRQIVLKNKHRRPMNPREALGLERYAGESPDREETIRTINTWYNSKYGSNGILIR